MQPLRQEAEVEFSFPFFNFLYNIFISFGSLAGEWGYARCLPLRRGGR